MDKFLLDTHVVLWIAENSPNIPSKIKQILSCHTVKCVSIASAWEIAIKLGNKGNKTINLPGGLPEFYKMVDFNTFFTLPIKRTYLIQLLSLPFIHKDPFDRLLIATALVEGLTIITADENIHQYNVPWVW